MSEIKGKQSIGCNVNSCKFFDNSHCTLSGIEVGASSNVSNGIAEDETLCKSYQKQDNSMQQSNSKRIRTDDITPLWP